MNSSSSSLDTSSSSNLDSSSISSGNGIFFEEQEDDLQESSSSTSVSVGEKRSAAEADMDSVGRDANEENILNSAEENLTRVGPRVPLATVAAGFR